DTMRGIILFYLMLCPCGAVWSIDSLLARWRGRAWPVFVSPWALRLLFVQMTLIYFMNGIYKLAGPEWREGTSLYYVLSDLTLARFSYAQIDLPLWLIKFLSWSVLIWEVAFPLWVALPWTRTAALLMGVAFHVGIMLTMELGGFGPYMLTLYLPLLPWERFSKHRASVGA
ncbi:MAG TPA: HTTM domain-containing protein, partial [Gemmataceae bacterium]|nr:HTTM domain-containing protein [Gemmataceae bacterium]